MDHKYSIKVISDSCGIKAHTLRVWEQRYGVFSPERNDSGRRVYGQYDFDRAKLLSQLLETGYSISELAYKDNAELDDLLAALVDKQGDKPLAELRQPKTLEIKRLFNHLDDFKIDDLVEEFSHLRINMGVKDFIFQIVLPLLREVGLLVAKGKFSVTQEHLISALVRDQLSQFYLPNPVGTYCDEIVLASPEGNLHELSIIIADMIAKSSRVSTRFLGAGHPADSLAGALNVLRSSKLVLGTLSSDQWFYDKKMSPYLSALDKNLNYPIEVFLGGGHKLDFPVFKNIKKVVILETFEKFDEILGGWL
jgi:DNA-binding transcriptional MerR regulator